MSFGSTALQIGGMVIGAVIGYFAGGQVVQGAMIGASIGGMVGGVAGAALFPDKADGVKVPPPQPRENRVQVSTYGAPIPIQYGSGRLAGNIIYMQDPVETVSTKNFREEGVRYTTKTMTYTSTFAIAFCEGPVDGISRIWVNNNLYADFRDPSGTFFPTGASTDIHQANLDTSIARQETYFSIYLGSESQTADPSIAAILGAALTPAYRGICYIVFKDFPVGEFQGIPTIEAEVIANGSTTTENMTVDLSAYDFSAYSAVDNDGNLIKFDNTSRLAYVFDQLTNRVLRTFAVAAPASYTHQGIGVDPSSRVILFAFDNELGLYSGRCVHYCYNSEGKFVTSWQDDSVYRGLRVSYAFTTDGMVVRYGTSQYYNSGWYYAPLMVLYQDYAGTRKDAYWGPCHPSNPTVLSWSQDEPVFGERTFGGLGGLVNTYINLVVGNSYWRFAWGSVNRTTSGIGDTAVIPAGYEVATDLDNPTGYHSGLAITAGGDLVTSTTDGNTVYVHSGITGTIKQRTRVLDAVVPLEDAIADICDRAGIGAAYIDTTALTSDDLVGYHVARQMPAKTALETLLTFYSVDVAEDDWKIVFKKRGGTSVATIAAAELAAHAYGGDLPDRAVTVRSQDAEIPTHLTVSYESRTLDYEIATQQAVRIDKPNLMRREISMGIVATNTKAKQVAEVLMKMLWRVRQSYKFSVRREYLWLAPGDVVTVSGQAMRIVEMSDADGVVWVMAEEEPGGVYESDAVADTLEVSQVDINKERYIPSFIPMNLPPIRVTDGDGGFYVAAHGDSTRYSGAAVQVSLDGGSSWTDQAVLGSADRAVVGLCTSTLGTGLEGCLDYTASVAVRITNSGDTLADATLDEMLEDGANLAAIGSDATGYEIIQFMTATLADGIYTLTGLLRGLYGTSRYMATHAASENFVMLDGFTGIDYVNLSTELIGTEILCRVRSPYGSVGSPTAFTSDGSTITPLPAQGAYATRLLSATPWCFLKWYPADRYFFEQADLADFYGGQQSEESESYEVDVIHPTSGAVLRTITATTPAATYTYADRVADGYPQTQPIVFDIYQMSSVVGRGIAKRVSV